jgi:hypothetical protein
MAKLVDVNLAEAWAEYKVAEATFPPAEINTTDGYTGLREVLAEYIAAYGMRRGASAVEAWAHVDEYFEGCYENGVTFTLADVLDWRKATVNEIRRG